MTSDKFAHGYMPVYREIFSQLGDRANICELGVWQGESLAVWQAIFPGALIAGVDTSPYASWPAGTIPVRCDQADPGLPEQLADLSPGGWDLIIDDCSHNGDLTAKSWANLWPQIVPGGYYVIEDWFTGFPGDPHPNDPDGKMLDLARSFLDLFESPANDLGVESVVYRYGMIILRKKGAGQ